MGVALKGNISETGSDTEAASNLLKSVQEKIIHDYAFDKIFSYANCANLIKANSLGMGDIILSNDYVTFLDFGYFLSLFADNGAFKWFNEQNKKQLAEFKKTIPKGKPIPVDMKLQMTKLESEVLNAENQRRETGKSIEMIKNTLPYSRFLMTDKYLVPLDDKYFRDDPNIVAFKYGSNMSVFGYVTNVIRKDNSSKYENYFAPLYDNVNKVMLSFFKGKDEVYIIHPVAVYY